MARRSLGLLRLLVVCWTAACHGGAIGDGAVPSAGVSPAPASGATRGAAAFDRCRLCHDPAADGARIAPSLRGIIGSRVAAASGYQYSPALANLGGTWSEERLDAFLEDPGGYARGSQMEAGRVADAAERKAIIEFLRGYR